jgi:hypothetical protein
LCRTHNIAKIAKIAGIAKIENLLSDSIDETVSPALRCTDFQSWQYRRFWQFWQCLQILAILAIPLDFGGESSEGTFRHELSPAYLRNSDFWILPLQSGAERFAGRS